jgi:hypothetical protein
MPLDYGTDTAWPPPAVQEAAPFYREWLTWYRGDVRELRAIYTAMTGTGNPPVRPSQMAGGLVGWLGRTFWGRPVNQSGQVRQHVPAAKDVASLSAALVFAEPPALNLPDAPAGDPSQAALDAIMDDNGVYAVLHQAAELGAAAGGVYLRQSANTALADGPICEAILPDQAIPDFYGPWLQSVTFWRIISEPEKSPVVRHLERHEMSAGPRPVCVVYHAVYEGATDRLGRRMSLADYPETERFAALVDDEGRIVIGTSRLDVQYIPDMLPNAAIPGTQLGRSAFYGAEPQMDQLDEVWSSWMRDIRLGKGRLVVPREYTRRSTTRGEGTYFDPEQEVFTAVSAQLGASDSPTLQISAQQFQIRVAEHQQTSAELWRIILKNAGLDGNEETSENTPAQTATGVNERASRKRSTRSVKIRYWTPQLRRASLVLQELQKMYWPGSFPGVARPADIEWPDAAAPDAETMARTLQLLDAAGAVSSRTKVEMLHPEWSAEQVDEEVVRIAGDAPAPPDPADPNAIPDDNPQVVGKPVDEGLTISGLSFEPASGAA